MKKFDCVQLQDLSYGSTFYFPGDKTKAVWTLTDKSVLNEFKKREVSMFGSNRKKMLSPFTQVIFLRQA